MGSFFLSHLVGLLEQPLLSWEAYPALTQGQRRQDFHLLDVLAPGVPRLPKALPDGVQQQAWYPPRNRAAPAILGVHFMKKE